MNLGTFTKPILLFGGPYSNLDALIALRAKAEELLIAPKNIICTGDIVAYCGEPFKTVEFIRDWGVHVLMGNCEESFASNADDCGCGFDEGSSCDLLSVEWFQFANKQLTIDQRKWFTSLPRKITFTVLNKQVEIVHGSITSINKFMFYSTAHKEFTEELSLTNADLVISGHSGIPFSKSVGTQLWHNTGAIGMPANDGSTHTWYSVLSPKNKTINIKTHALIYNYQNAHNKMLQNGLSNGYAETLLSGIWPSYDVLPFKERSQQGMPLQAQEIDFD